MLQGYRLQCGRAEQWGQSGYFSVMDLRWQLQKKNLFIGPELIFLKNGHLAHVRIQKAKLNHWTSVSPHNVKWWSTYILDWSPSNACLQVCGLKRFRWHAGYQEVSRCQTKGESEEYMVHKEQACRQGNPPWFRNPEQSSPEVQKGVSVVAQKELMSPK